MTLIRQVVQDLVKDVGWVIFYGFLTAMSIMAFVLVGLSYQHVASQNDAIRRFTQNDVSMVRVKDFSSIRAGNGDPYAVLQSAAPGASYPYVAASENGWIAVALPDRVGWLPKNAARVT